MTDRLVKYFEAVSAGTDSEYRDKLTKASTEEEIIELAKEKGYILTKEDFDNKAGSGELSDDEVEAVTGGSTCACFAGGGGTEDEIMNTCACVIYGAGTYKNPRYEYGNTVSCACSWIGGGGD